MRYVLLAFALAACSRSQAPITTTDTAQDAVPLAEDVTTVDAADAVSPADAPSAVTP